MPEAQLARLSANAATPTLADPNDRMPLAVAQALMPNAAAHKLPITPDLRMPNASAVRTSNVLECCTARPRVGARARSSGR